MNYVDTNTVMFTVTGLGNWAYGYKNEVGCFSYFHTEGYTVIKAACKNV